MEWVEAIEFTYTNSDGDIISSVIQREGGIQQEDARRAFADFLRGCGFSVEEEE